MAIMAIMRQSVKYRYYFHVSIALSWDSETDYGPDGCMNIMKILVVEFSREGYKIRNVFG